MSENTKSNKVYFAPGCFDTFEGSQEELDDLMLEIQRLADTGELTERVHLVNVDEIDTLFEDEPELAEKLLQFAEADGIKRNLQ